MICMVMWPNGVLIGGRIIFELPRKWILKVRLRRIVVSCEAVAGMTATTRVLPPRVAARIATTTTTTTTTARTRATATISWAFACAVFPQNNRGGVSRTG